MRPGELTAGGTGRQPGLASEYCRAAAAAERAAQGNFRSMVREDGGNSPADLKEVKLKCRIALCCVWTYLESG